MRLYTCLYTAVLRARLRPSAHEESRGYIQLLKLEAPSPLVKHSGKRSCCNSTPRHPCRRCLLLLFLCLFFVPLWRCPFLPLSPAISAVSFSSTFFLHSFFSLVLRKLIYLYIPLFSTSLSLSFSFHYILFFTFQCNFATTKASILKQSSFFYLDH